MSTDAVFHTSPLERVREDMTVEDGAGAPLGKVKHLRTGDLQAGTTRGQGSAGTSVGVAAAPASSSGGTTAFGAAMPPADIPYMPDVPEPLRTTLCRAGFIELKDTHLGVRALSAEVRPSPALRATSRRWRGGRPNGDEARRPREHGPKPSEYALTVRQPVATVTATKSSDNCHTSTREV